jgi:hypothetical protein
MASVKKLRPLAPSRRHIEERVASMAELGNRRKKGS